MAQSNVQWHVVLDLSVRLTVHRYCLKIAKLVSANKDPPKDLIMV